MALLFAKNNSLSAVTELPASISGGGLNLISTQTASSSATIDFTSGIDSTYKEYIFKFYNMHPSNDTSSFGVNFRDGGTDYDAVKTTSYFDSYHTENDVTAGSGYSTSGDLAQSTDFQYLIYNIGNANDESASGFLHLFDPSSTTFVKFFMSRMNEVRDTDASIEVYVGGYCNTTSAIDGVQFKMSSGSIESGVIKMYGVT